MVSMFDKPMSIEDMLNFIGVVQEWLPVRRF